MHILNPNMEIVEFLRKWLLINIFVKKSKVKKELIMVLWMIMLWSKPMFAANCPASIPTSQYTVYHQDTINYILSMCFILTIKIKIKLDLVNL